MAGALVSTTPRHSQNRFRSSICWIKLLGD